MGRWSALLFCFLVGLGGMGGTALWGKTRNVAIGDPLTPVPVENLSDASIVPSAQFIRDPGRRLTPESLASNRSPEVGIQYLDEEPNFGYTEDRVWMRFQLTGWAKRTNDLILEMRFSQVDELVLFLPDGKGGWRAKTNGMMKPLSARDVIHRHMVFTLDAHSAHDGVYLLRADSQDNLLMPVVLQDPQVFYKNTFYSSLGFGAYFGIYIALMIFNLFLFISLRDRAFLWYSIFLTWFGVWMASQLGFLNLLAWPILDRYPALNHHMQFGIAIALLLTVEFSMGFLDLRRRHVPLWGYLRGFQSLTVLILLIGLVAMSYGQQVQIQLVMLLPAIAGIFAAAIVVVAQGDRSARYFLAAWSALLGTGVVFILTMLNVVPVNFWTYHAVNFGSAAEMLLLAFALADRYDRLRAGKLAAEREALQVRLDLERVAEDKLYRDNATGLANRVRLMRDLAVDRPATLYILNIDRFRQINKFYGKEAGDALLRMVSVDLGSWCHDRGLRLYKLRGDEFGILQDGVGDGALALADDLRLFIEGRDYVWHENQIPLEITVGFCQGREFLAERADVALRAARQKRRGVLSWEPELEDHQEVAVNLAWVRRMKDALAENRITGFYQPIQNLASGRVEKYEILMRLLERDGTVVSPAQFLPAARYSRLYGELSRCIFQVVSRSVAEEPCEFSINLSVDDMRDETTVAALMRMVAACPHPERLVFEILESEGVAAYEELCRFLENLKGYGCRIAIDDFGTGYSNFSHVLRLPVDYLKIDGSLIRNIDTDHQSRVLVTNIVDFSRKLGIKTIAEFVHSPAVHGVVESLGIDYAQGYHVGAPAPRWRKREG